MIAKSDYTVRHKKCYGNETS